MNNPLLSPAVSDGDNTNMTANIGDGSHALVYDEEIDVELQTLVSLRTALSSTLLMLENARDDLVIHDERCRHLAGASAATRSNVQEQEQKQLVCYNDTETKNSHSRSTRKYYPGDTTMKP